jgi:hypothetical protein
VVANRRTIVTLSMLWLGFLIFASRDWAQQTRDYVRAKTGHSASSASATTQGGKTAA